MVIHSILKSSAFLNVEIQFLYFVFCGVLFFSVFSIYWQNYCGLQKMEGPFLVKMHYISYLEQLPEGIGAQDEI
jgi:hypothetical protein